MSHFSGCLWEFEHAALGGKERALPLLTDNLKSRQALLIPPRAHDVTARQQPPRRRKACPHSSVLRELALHERLWEPALRLPSAAEHSPARV